MTHIYFIRHAEPNYDNHDDVSRELSPKGLADRTLVTDFLADRSIDLVLSSPFKRAVDTVQDFSDRYNLPITTVDDFRERRVDSGWIEDFHSFSMKQWEDFSYKLQDGESLGEVQKRNIAALKKVLKKHVDKTIAIASHGTALSTIINYYEPSFRFADFERIRPIMPWVVHFTFDGTTCMAIDEYDLFTNSYSVIYCD